MSVKPRGVGIFGCLIGIPLTFTGAGATAHDKALGYYYGGRPTNATDARILSTMVVYDMLNNKFTTQSEPDHVGRGEGVMLYIPAGNAGILVYFGGVQMVAGVQEPLPMSDIFVYDIANARWYKQTTSGAELPGSRRRFCAGAVWAGDRSSYNIYLYGGASAGQGIGYGDVWILNLPSFTWIKFFPTSEDDATTIPHHSLTCDVYESPQMIIMGGHFTNSTDCDVPSIYGQHGLDLGRANKDGLKWAAFNASLTSYNVPIEITDVIGGNSSGGATSPAPMNGWDSRDLGIVFGRHYTPAARVPNRSIPVPAGSTTEQSILGPAVGGAIGGFIFVVAIGVCLFFLRRRRRRVAEMAPIEPRYHISRPSPHVELPVALDRSYSSASLFRLAPGCAPDTSQHTGISSASPPSWQGTWPGTDRLADHSQTRGIGELGNLKEKVLLMPVHELPSVRSPMEVGFSIQSPRQSKFREEEVSRG